MASQNVTEKARESDGPGHQSLSMEEQPKIDINKPKPWGYIDFTQDMEEPINWTTYLIDIPTVSIGRGPGSTFKTLNLKVSRNICTITCKKEKGSNLAVLEALSKRIHNQLNGKELRPGSTHELQNNAIISIPNIKFKWRYYEPEDTSIAIQPKIPRISENRVYVDRKGSTMGEGSSSGSQTTLPPPAKEEDEEKKKVGQDQGVVEVETFDSSTGSHASVASTDPAKGKKNQEEDDTESTDYDSDAVNSALDPKEDKIMEIQSTGSCSSIRAPQNMSVDFWLELLNPSENEYELELFGPNYPTTKHPKSHILQNANDNANVQGPSSVLPKERTTEDIPYITHGTENPVEHTTQTNENGKGAEKAIPQTALNIKQTEEQDISVKKQIEENGNQINIPQDQKIPLNQPGVHNERVDSSKMNPISIDKIQKEDHQNAPYKASILITNTTQVPPEDKGQSIKQGPQSVPGNNLEETTQMHAYSPICHTNESTGPTPSMLKGQLHEKTFETEQEKVAGTENLEILIPGTADDKPNPQPRSQHISLIANELERSDMGTSLVHHNQQCSNNLIPTSPQDTDNSINPKYFGEELDEGQKSSTTQNKDQRKETPFKKDQENTRQSNSNQKPVTDIPQTAQNAKNANDETQMFNASKEGRSNESKVSNPNPPKSAGTEAFEQTIPPPQIESNVSKSNHDTKEKCGSPKDCEGETDGRPNDDVVGKKNTKKSVKTKSPVRKKDKPQTIKGASHKTRRAVELESSEEDSDPEETRGPRIVQKISFCKPATSPQSRKLDKSIKSTSIEPEVNLAVKRNEVKSRTSVETKSPKSSRKRVYSRTRKRDTKEKGGKDFNTSKKVAAKKRSNPHENKDLSDEKSEEESEEKKKRAKVDTSKGKNLVRDNKIDAEENTIDSALTTTDQSIKEKTRSRRNKRSPSVERRRCGQRR